MDGWIDRWMNGQMDGLVDICMYVHINGFTHINLTMNCYSIHYCDQS